MATKGNNGLTGTYMFRQLTGVNGRYQLTTERLMSEFYRDSMSTATDGIFKAVCLSGIRTGENEGTGIDANDASINKGYGEIIVRPLSPFGDILPDPRIYTDPKNINDAITIHKTMFTARSDFEFKDQNPIAFGQIINCYFEDGSIANSDFSGLRFSEPQGFNSDESFAKLADIEGVATGMGAFAGGNASLLGFPPTESSNEDINALAARYDKEPSYQKSRNSGLIAKAHPEFQNYIKAFITKSKDSKISIHLNSTHRNRAKQDKLIAEHAAGERRIKPAATSYHLVGLAFDFNPIVNNKSIKSTRPKKEWINSGVVAIGESVGLRWGGNFSSNYDPVHFDLGNKVTKTRMATMVAEAKKKNVEGTQIPTGQKV